MLVVLSISDLVEEGHNDVDDSQHEGQRHINIEVHRILKSNSPPKRQQQQNDNDGRISDGMQE